MKLVAVADGMLGLASDADPNRSALVFVQSELKHLATALTCRVGEMMSDV